MSDSREGPPAFWEICNREPVMGVSVHRIDAQLDHGELLGAAEVPIFDGDGPGAVKERAYGVDFRLVGEVVADGTSEGIAVNSENGKVRTLPSRSKLQTVQARLGRPIRLDDFRTARLPLLPDPLP